VSVDTKPRPGLTVEIIDKAIESLTDPGVEDFPKPPVLRCAIAIGARCAKQCLWFEGGRCAALMGASNVRIHPGKERIYRSQVSTDGRDDRVVVPAIPAHACPEDTQAPVNLCAIQRGERIISDAPSSPDETQPDWGSAEDYYQ